MTSSKKQLLKKAVILAHKNNVQKNLPLTLVKITDYKDDNITVNKERIYLIFNKEGSKQFKTAIFDILKHIVQFEFGKVNIKTTAAYIEFR